jgi:hypothetical protein
MNTYLAKPVALAIFLSVAACGGDDTSASNQPGGDNTGGTGTAGSAGTNAGTSVGGSSGAGGGGSGTGGVVGTGGMSNDASSSGDARDASVANTGDGATSDAAAGNVITDPSVEDAAGTSWSKIGGCGTYTQSSTVFHTGAHSASVTARTGAFCGVANGSLPLVDGSYTVSAFGRWEAGATGLTTVNLRLSARVDCANPASQKFVTIVNSVAADPAMWVSLSGPLNVQTAITDGGNAAACSMTGQTLSHIYIFLEQVNGDVFPDLFMDDLSAQSP